MYIDIKKKKKKKKKKIECRSKDSNPHEETCVIFKNSKNPREHRATSNSCLLFCSYKVIK